MLLTTGLGAALPTQGDPGASLSGATCPASNLQGTLWCPTWNNAPSPTSDARLLSHPSQDLAYVTGTTSDDTLEVQAVDTVFGETQWTFEREVLDDRFEALLSPGGDHLYLALWAPTPMGAVTEVLSLDAETGVVRWSHVVDLSGPQEDPFTKPLGMQIEAGTGLLAVHAFQVQIQGPDVVLALHAATGYEAWTWDITDLPEGVPTDGFAVLSTVDDDPARFLVDVTRGPFFAGVAEASSSMDVSRISLDAGTGDALLLGTGSGLLGDLDGRTTFLPQMDAVLEVEDPSSWSGEEDTNSVTLRPLTGGPEVWEVSLELTPGADCLGRALIDEALGVAYLVGRGLETETHSPEDLLTPHLVPGTLTYETEPEPVLQALALDLEDGALLWHETYSGLVHQPAGPDGWCPSPAALTPDGNRLLLTTPAHLREDPGWLLGARLAYTQDVVLHAVATADGELGESTVYDGPHHSRDVPLNVAASGSGGEALLLVSSDEQQRIEGQPVFAPVHQTYREVRGATATGELMLSLLPVNERLGGEATATVRLLGYRLG